ncbi:MAG: sel1 repeat family protein [Filomicrobium sp.]
MLHRCVLAAPLIMVLLAGPAVATSETDDGFHNPENGSIAHFLRRMEAGDVDPMGSVFGYAAAKSGDYTSARKIFEYFAARGNTQAMTWMSWLEDNGFGGPENAEAAASWDRMAMEAGDHIGTFNYGLDLLRGRGVAQDILKGRQMIDRAAAMGEKSAQELKAADYDLDVVTPDADNWKYNPYLY